jgi:hypothetical protein
VCWELGAIASDEDKEQNHMSTGQSSQPVTEQTQPVQAAPPATSWEIQTADGNTLGRLSQSTIVQGLREGWLSLDDTARQGETDWQPIRSTLGESVFGVKVLISSPGAHAQQGAMYGAGGLAIISALGALVNLSMTVLHLDIGRTIVFLVVMVVTTMVVFRVRSLVALGVVLVIALAVLRAVAGIPLDLAAVGGIAIGTGLSFGIGAVIGYGVGHAVGWIVGTLRRDRYRLPKTRQPVPEWVTSATSNKQ